MKVNITLFLEKRQVAFIKAGAFAGINTVYNCLQEKKTSEVNLPLHFDWS